MTTATKTLLQTNVNELSFVGDKVLVDPSLGNMNGLHTVSYAVRNFVGKVAIQGTLRDDPTEDDWFDVVPEDEFPEDPNNPSGDNDGDTTTTGSTFRANLTYMRLSVDRSYLPETEYDRDVHGIIERAFLNV